MASSAPFVLQPLLYPALPAQPGVNPDSPAALARSLRCAEPFGSHIYLGTSDGTVLCFQQEQDSKSASDGDVSLQGGSKVPEVKLVSTRTVSSKAIEKILVMPAVSIAAVLTESTLSFYALPAFDAIPQQVLPHIKGVAALALDDAESDVDGEGLVGLCVIRRKAIMLVRMSIDTWRIVKEIPLPGGATGARRFGNWLCISTTSDYSVVDLDAATISAVGLPISQTSSAPSASSRPSVVAVRKSPKSRSCEFLITSHSEDVTLGAFVSQEGEPTSKLIEWPSHPRALALDYPFLHALLRNDTIEVHDLRSLQKVQTVHLPPLLEPRSLSAATSKLEIKEWDNQEMLATASFTVRQGKVQKAETVNSPSYQRLEPRTTASRVILIGKNAVQHLTPVQLWDAALKAIRRHDYKRSVALLEQILEQEQRDGESSSSKVFQDFEQRYLEQRLGLECLRLLKFEEAAEHLQRGRFPMDVLVTLFPSMSAGLYESVSSQAFADVLEDVLDLGDLESFPSANVSFNYAPILDADTDKDLSTLVASIRQEVGIFCKKMLLWYRDSTEGKALVTNHRVLDTMIARVFIEEKDRDSISAFMADPTSQCDVALIEEGLESVGCYGILLNVARGRGETGRCLELYSKLLDKTLEDPHFSGNLQDFANLVMLCEDAQLSHQYGIWLVQRDTAAGVKILSKGKGNVQRDELATYLELKLADADAALAFLEATALSRKQQNPAMHKKLFDVLLQQIQDGLSSPEEHSLIDAVAQEYSHGGYAESFVAHLSLRSQEAKSVTPRLKLMMLLQGSSLLDPLETIGILGSMPELKYELAIVYGKSQRDEDALEILAIRLRDANSSETYCSQGRRPLSAVLVQSLDAPQLKVYVTFAQRSLKRKHGESRSKGNPSEDLAASKIALIKKLLHVYMQKDDNNNFQVATSHLLNTQAMHLSAAEILETVPAHWSAKTLENFLSRSLRREMHRAHEGHIQRAMALSQNLEVAQDLWSQRRAMGGVIEDGTEGDGGGIDHQRLEPMHDEDEASRSASFDERPALSLAEKAIRQEKDLLQEGAVDDVASITPDE